MVDRYPQVMSRIINCVTFKNDEPSLSPTSLSSEISKTPYDLAVVDLDGTLLPGNSFSMFTLHLFKKEARLRLPLLRIVAARKLRLITHAEAKRRIMIRAGELPDSIIKDFVKKLTSKIDPELLALCNGCSATVLTTAAPDLYALPLADALGFKYCFASYLYTIVQEPMSSDPPTQAKSFAMLLHENKGEAKVASLLSAGFKLGSKSLVLTDHFDDLPLLRANRDGRNLLIEKK